MNISRNWLAKYVTIDCDLAALCEKLTMRVAVAEMLYLDDVPPVVSIDEAVGIARDYSGIEAGNFINGVLNGVKDTLKRDPRGGKEPKGE